MPSPILYESHCHTPLCRHAVGEPTEYAEMAAQRGLKGITFTCHCPLPDGISANVRMRPEEFANYVSLVEEARDAMDGVVDVRLGLESDYYPGVEPWLEKLHASERFNHILGSVHYQVGDYRKLYFTGDVFAYQQMYYDHLAAAAETGLYDTLAHPDLIKNEDPAQWEFPRIQPFVERSLDRIAATGVAMELNTSGTQKALPEMNPGIAQLELMHERGIPVVIGADAHRPERVGDGYGEALRTLKSVGYREVSIFLDRKRRAIPIDAALASLQGFSIFGVPASVA